MAHHEHQQEHLDRKVDEALRLGTAANSSGATMTTTHSNADSGEARERISVNAPSATKARRHNRTRSTHLWTRS